MANPKETPACLLGTFLRLRKENRIVSCGNAMKALTLLVLALCVLVLALKL